MMESGARPVPELEEATAWRRPHGALAAASAAPAAGEGVAARVEGAGRRRSDVPLARSRAAGSSPSRAATIAQAVAVGSPSSAPTRPTHARLGEVRSERMVRRSMPARSATRRSLAPIDRTPSAKSPRMRRRWRASASSRAPASSRASATSRVWALAASVARVVALASSCVVADPAPDVRLGMAPIARPGTPSDASRPEAPATPGVARDERARPSETCVPRLVACEPGAPRSPAPVVPPIAGSRSIASMGRTVPPRSECSRGVHPD